tara:strand:+ start:1368 stop:6041 length:4674 start_codon:yes stop_codon:yes gene_type:complete
MDVLNLTPDAVPTADTTQNIEGYEDHVEDIQKAYPEEDWRTPAEIEAEEQATMQQASDDAFNPGSVAQEQPLGVAEQPEVTAEQPEVVEPEVVEPVKLHYQVNEDNTMDLDSYQDYDGNYVFRGEHGRKVANYFKASIIRNDEEEGALKDLFEDGLNLQSQIKAFNMIRNSPHLSAVHDTNGDGEITYDDFHDTTHMEEWDEELGRLNPETDAELTQEWINGLETGDLGSRARALWQQAGPGQNMARYINLRRQHLFAPQDQIDTGEDWRQNLSGGIFNAGQQELGFWGSVGQMLNGENPLSNTTWDDELTQYKNPQSLEFGINNEIKRLRGSGAAGHLGYWPTTGFFTWLKLKGVALTGGAVAPALGLKAGAVKTAVMSPLTWKKGVGIKHALGQAGKVTIAETLPQAAFADLQADGWNHMREDGALHGLANLYPETAIFGPQVAQGIESPIFKQADFVVSEVAGGAGAIAGFAGLGHIITKSAPEAFTWMVKSGVKFAGKQREAMGVSAKNISNAIEAPLADQAHWFAKQQTQLKDWTEAGRVQMGKAYEGARNAFNSSLDAEDGILRSGYGVYKDGQKMWGQGLTKARSGIRQAINDLDEIRNTIGIGKKGSTDSLFSQVDMANAVKRGVDEKQLDLFRDELMNDSVWKQQIKNLNPLKRTRRVVSESSELGIREVLGRDAASLSPDAFWGKTILDQPLDVKDFSKATDFEKWAIKNIEVQDAVNESLLLQLRDSAMAGGELIDHTDIFAIDGTMRKIADNLVVGLGQVKKTQHTWDLARQMMREGDGKLSQEQLIDLAAQVGKRSSESHNQTKRSVQSMLNMMMEQPDNEFAKALLDVVKASDEVHNLKDLDAFMHQKLVGGEFAGKVKTGALISDLQQVMVQSILSGPKTPLRAMLGTTVNTYANAINEAFGAMIRSPFTGDIASRKASVAKLRAYFGQIPEAYKVFQKSWNSKFDADIADIKTRFSDGSTVSKGDKLFEAEGRWVELRGTPGEKAAYYGHNITRNLVNNKLFGWSPRALAAVDDTYLWLMARTRSKELAMREVLEAAGDSHVKITPELLKKAEDIHYNRLLDGNGNIDIRKDSWFAKQFEEVTLTSPLKGTAAKLDDVFNSMPLMKPFYLFARTGINGLNFSFKSTPLLGALHRESLDILSHKGTDFTKLAKYGIENANDLANARNLFAGRQAVGAAAVTTFAGMYMAGQLTGNGPADRQLKQQWINAGWKPNHFYIGDVGFDYTTLEPYNVIFSAIADIGDNMELMGSEWAEKRLQAAAFVIGRGLTGKTYMSGLDQMMQIAQMKPGALEKGVGNIMNNSIPLAGMRNEFGKWANPHMKELNSSMWDSIRNRNQATEFLAGEGALPAKSDLLNGKPIKNWNIISRSFNAVSPVSLDIRNDTPGRRLLLDSHYDLKSTTYSYGGYSFVKDNHVRAHFQNAIGTVPITVGFKKFKNVEEALNHLASRTDVKNSMSKMRENSKNPALWDVDPNDYPHNTLIDNVMDQARSKAWAKINDPSHKGYARLQTLKSEQDGKDARTRDTRSELLELNYPSKQVEQFPK